MASPKSGRIGRAHLALGMLNRSPPRPADGGISSIAARTCGGFSWLRWLP